MNYNSLCYSCFGEKPIADRPCPKCGYVYKPNEVKHNCLLPGTMLHNRYLIGRALGVGGFGITYKCFDTKLGGICAVKEYFPGSYASIQPVSGLVYVDPENAERYAHIMKSFVAEAEMLGKLDHPNIIKSFDNFSENNTAYYVMEYCDGIDLRTYTDGFKKKLDGETGMRFLTEVMNGLEYIHSKDILHRDIAPDNIYVTKSGHVKILDFGAARREMVQTNKALSVIVKMGYAPLEQYGSRVKQGTYTDIYALGATFYHLFTGVIPEESTQRVAGDELVPLSKLRPDLPDSLKYCIERAMTVSATARLQTISDMRYALGISHQPTPKPPVSGSASGGNVPAIQAYPAKQVSQNNPVLNNNPVSPQRPVSGNGNVVQQKSDFSHNPNSFHSAQPTPNSSGNRVVFADIPSRVVAYIIDIAIVSFVYSMFFAASYIAEYEYYYTGAIALSCLFYPVVVFLYGFVMEASVGATLGKMIKGLYVRGHVSSKAMTGQLALRNVIKLLGVFVLFSGSEGMMLQDKCTRSVVCIKQ